jgi:hypothetical protein
MDDKIMYDKLFKNCNIIYFNSASKFKDLVKNLKGKIIISNLKEIIDICNINGILCIFTTSKVPNENIDCIVSGKVEDFQNSEIHTVYIDDNKKWCGICNSFTILSENYSVTKYCSELCMQKHNGFTKNFTPEPIRDLDLKNVLDRIKPTPVTSNDLKSTSKFQRSMEKDAVRLVYAFRREDYKKDMRQPSLRKASISDKKKKVGENLNEKNDIHFGVKICKGITKKGEKCTNKSLNSSNFCGILSHSMNSS